jgi:hypothetical protein
VASGFRPAFRNYFLTAQLAAGLALAIKAGLEGAKESGLATGVLWGLAGFLIAIPMSALVAFLMAIADAKGLMLDRRINWPRALLLSGAVVATFFAALMVLP